MPGDGSRAPLFMWLGCAAALALALALGIAAGLRRGGAPPADVVVASSYLECALRTLLGDALTVSSLVPPGSCPGHFDLSPAQARQIRRCRLLLLFDIQEGLAARLGDDPGAARIAHIPLGDGMLLPTTFLAAASRVATALADAFPEQRPAVDQGLARLAAEMAALDEELDRASAAISGRARRAAIASVHQAAFCRRVGLDVIAELSAPDEARLSQLQACLDKGREAGVSVVVANLQEGEGLARAVADALGAPLVVLSNFPTLAPGQVSFAGFVTDNLRRLQGALAP